MSLSGRKTSATVSGTGSGTVSDTVSDTIFGAGADADANLGWEL